VKILILYVVTAVVFFLADAVGLRLLIKPVFERHVAHLFATPFRTIPAALFYLGYVAGILWFVSVPGFHTDNPGSALFGGFLLGLMAYGTYEFTNYATLSAWSVEQVVTDTLWGGVLTGFSAWSGIVIVRAIL